MLGKLEHDLRVENGGESTNDPEDELVMVEAQAHKKPSSSMAVLTPAEPPEDDHELDQLDEDDGYQGLRRDDHDLVDASANLLMNLSEIGQVGVFRRLIGLVGMDAGVGVGMYDVDVRRCCAQSLMVE